MTKKYAFDNKDRTVQVKQICKTCKGTGVEYNNKYVKVCSKCDGYGITNE